MDFAIEIQLLLACVPFKSYPCQRQQTTKDNVQIRFWLVPEPRILLDTSFRKLNKWRWSRARRGNRGETGALVGPAARLWVMRLNAVGIARHLALGRPRCCPRQDYNRASRIRHPLPRAHGAILSLQVGGRCPGPALDKGHERCQRCAACVNAGTSTPRLRALPLQAVCQDVTYHICLIAARRAGGDNIRDRRIWSARSEMGSHGPGEAADSDLNESKVVPHCRELLSGSSRRLTILGR